MAATNQLSRVAAEPGRPLYLIVRDAVRSAVDAGNFIPGQKLPNTQVLSEQMHVSLVTAHRALQELVTAGVLYRLQGKGTYVNPRYLEQKGVRSVMSVGLVLERGVSVSEYYHGQIFEGVRLAAEQRGVDLILLSYGEDTRNICNGYIFINPRAVDLAAFVEFAGIQRPVLVAGARSHLKRVTSIDVDNVELARRAVQYLSGLGHRRIGYVGGNVDASNSQDRREGFHTACRELGLSIDPADQVQAAGWQLTDDEKDRLGRMLDRHDRPTAVFAAGYYFGLAVYTCAAALKLKIPGDVSVIGVDDPPSATHLLPPLTTLRQPLIPLGQTAFDVLYDRLAASGGRAVNVTLSAELVIRGSCAHG